MNKKLKFFIGVFIGSSTLSYAETVSSGNRKPMEISGSAPAQIAAPAPPQKPVFTRSIFLNGMNINSIRNQDLDDVSLFIDKKGNVYIEAPQYEVGAENSARSRMPKGNSRTERTARNEMGPKTKGRFSQEPEKSVVLDEIDENEPIIYKSER